jgi:diadenosine tetraphosphatase ApaH/serine/threonine PP2A family protein phosphatase
LTQEGNKYLINVGSVGQPRDGDPRACYCIFDTDKKTISIKRVEYDVKKAHDKILAAGLPIMLAYRLLEGR